MTELFIFLLNCSILLKIKYLSKSYTPVLNMPSIISSFEFRTGPSIVMDFPGILI